MRSLRRHEAIQDGAFRPPARTPADRNPLAEWDPWKEIERQQQGDDAWEAAPTSAASSPTGEKRADFWAEWDHDSNIRRE